MTKRNIIWVLGIASALLLAGYCFLPHTDSMAKKQLPIELGIYSPFVGEKGVTVERIAVPAPWDKPKTIADYYDAPTGVYQTERQQDDLYAYVLIHGTNNDTLTLQSPTVTLRDQMLYIQATQTNLDPKRPVCCPALFAFKFKIPNVPQGELKVIFNN